LLLKLLKKCPSGVFSEIVYSCLPPAGALSSDQAPQATRAVELLKWAEGDGGIGLSAVHDCYLEAMEIENNSQELSLESPSETDKPGKVVPIEELREQQEAISNLSRLEQSRKHLKNAQSFADDAYKPFATYTAFDEKAKPEREKFIDAVDLLGEAEQSIQSLRDLLFSDSSFIPDELLENRDFINVHIDTVIEQIDEHLLPSLSQNEIGDFSKLQKALQKINDLFPELKYI
ncbi:MAG TPA: hypothetical protein VEP90_27565, partial [Methylomirabilota bacterium]|nr:hypothetical protein [Methylomirabilota bacterium]